MAELEWVEERWWHRLLKVSGCLVALLSTLLAGFLCYAYIDTRTTHMTWERRAPSGAAISQCFEPGSTYSWRCSVSSPYELADKLHEAGEITAEERVEVYSLDMQPALERLELMTRARRIGYWVEDTITFREVVASIAITLATPVVLGLLMRFGYLFLLYIAHGHTRVRPKA